MRKLFIILALIVLAVVPIIGQNTSSTFTAADTYIHMNVTNAIGTQLTNAIMTTGTSGTFSAWTSSPTPPTGMLLATNHCPPPLRNITVNRKGEFPRLFPSQSISLDNTKNNTYEEFDLNAGVQQLTVQGCIILGPPNQGVSSSLFDFVEITGSITGDEVILQLDNGEGLANGRYEIYFETLPNGVTTEIALCTVSQFQAIYYVMSADYSKNPGNATLVIYDARTGAYLGGLYNQAVHGGAEVAEDIGNVRFGNNEAGSVAGTTYFEQTAITYGIVGSTGAGTLPLKPIWKSAGAATPVRRRASVVQ